uniref:Uncharacterized protein n=1 Tax=Oryza punctata TaxID=4537 RepID=A0A0E0JWS1_ORYPU
MVELEVSLKGIFVSTCNLWLLLRNGEMRYSICVQQEGKGSIFPGNVYLKSYNSCNTYKLFLQKEQLKLGAVHLSLEVKCSETYFICLTYEEDMFLQITYFVGHNYEGSNTCSTHQFSHGWPEYLPNPLCRRHHLLLHCHHPLLASYSGAMSQLWDNHDSARRVMGEATKERSLFLQEDYIEVVMQSFNM